MFSSAKTAQYIGEKLLSSVQYSSAPAETKAFAVVSSPQKHALVIHDGDIERVPRSPFMNAPCLTELTDSPTGSSDIFQLKKTKQPLVER